MDPRDFLGVAKTLIEGTNPDAATCRTVISRSYYAAFNVASGIITELNIPLDKQKDSHKEVVDILGRCGNPRLQSIAKRLDDQRAVRKNADYKMVNGDVENAQYASKTYCICKGVVDDIDMLRADDKKWTLAVQALLAYAKILRKP